MIFRHLILGHVGNNDRIGHSCQGSKGHRYGDQDASISGCQVEVVDLPAFNIHNEWLVLMMMMMILNVCSSMCHCLQRLWVSQ